MIDDTEILVHWGADSRDSQPLFVITGVDSGAVPADYFSDSMLSSEYAPAYLANVVVKHEGREDVFLPMPTAIKQEAYDDDDGDFLLCIEQLDFPPPPPVETPIATIPSSSAASQRQRKKKKEVIKKVRVGQLNGRYVVFTRREFERICKRAFAVKSK